MATAPAALDAYREEADRFIAPYRRGVLPHFAGLKESFELTPIYERYADLRRSTCRRLGEAASPPIGAGRALALRLRGLPRQPHARGGRGDRRPRGARSRRGRRRGDRLPPPPPSHRERARPRPPRAPRPRQGRADGRSTRTTCAWPKSGESDGTLGAETYRDLYARFGSRWTSSRVSAERFLAATEDLYVSPHSTGSPARRRAVGGRRSGGTCLGSSERPSGTRASRPEAMVPALEATLLGLGIDLRRQENVHLDVEARPTKKPAGLCAPIEVPAA